MADVGKLIDELRQESAEADAAAAVVDLVRATGDMLQRMRERRGLSQEALGEQLGISRGRVSQLESGLLRHAPSLQTIARWAQACGEVATVEVSGDHRVDPTDAQQVEELVRTTFEHAISPLATGMVVRVMQVGRKDKHHPKYSVTVEADIPQEVGYLHHE